MIQITLKENKIIIRKKSEQEVSFYCPLNNKDEQVLNIFPLETKQKLEKLSLIDDIIYLSITKKVTTIWMTAGSPVNDILGEYLRIFEIKYHSINIDETLK